MAVVGPSRHPRGMMPTNQHAILAAAAPFYHAAGPPHAHQASTPGHPGVPGEVPAPLDVQPDRPIGYGAFGVVW